MRKKWTRCALKLYWLRNAPTTTAGIPSRHGAANSKFSAVVRTHRALVLLAQRVVEATSDRRHKGHPRFRRRLCFSMIIGLSSDADRGKSSATRSEEHTSELQSQSNLVCRLLLEKKRSQTAPS